MLLLRPNKLEEDLPTILVRSNKKLTVGRKGCDVCLDGRSISRVHATLEVKGELYGPDEAPKKTTIETLIIHDNDSKLGTFYMKNKSDPPIKIDGRQELLIGDLIIFGSRTYIYRIENCDISVCFSGISQETIRNITTKIHASGLTIASSWKSDYTHLIAQGSKLTFKFLLALCQKKHIVTTSWIDEIYVGSLYPPEKKYYPKSAPSKIANDICSSMEANIDRSRLFSSLLFICHDEIKDISIVEAILKLCGANVKHINTDYELNNLISDNQGCLCSHFVITTTNPTPKFQTFLVKVSDELRARPITTENIARMIICNNTNFTQPTLNKCPECFKKKNAYTPSPFLDPNTPVLNFNNKRQIFGHEASKSPESKKKKSSGAYFTASHDEFMDVIFTPLVVVNKNELDTQ